VAGHNSSQGDVYCLKYRAADKNPDINRDQNYGAVGMKIERRFTKTKTGAYGEIDFRKTSSEIRNPDGSVVFKLDDMDVPASWSQVASDVLAQKYFRKAGVPAALKSVKENSQAGL
jgi:hypothetical protein